MSIQTPSEQSFLFLITTFSTFSIYNQFTSPIGRGSEIGEFMSVKWRYLVWEVGAEVSGLSIFIAAVWNCVHISHPPPPPIYYLLFLPFTPQQLSKQNDHSLSPFRGIHSHSHTRSPLRGIPIRAKTSRGWNAELGHSHARSWWETLGRREVDFWWKNPSPSGRNFRFR